jgi:hypothetical protein
VLASESVFTVQSYKQHDHESPHGRGDESDIQLPFDVPPLRVTHGLRANGGAQPPHELDMWSYNILVALDDT